MTQTLVGTDGVRVVSGKVVAPWDMVAGSEQKLPLKDPNQKTYGVNLIRRDFIQPNTGTVGQFVCVKKANGGTVLAILETGEVILVEQFKQGGGLVTLEFVAFMPNEGLDNELTAIEELHSEAGLAAATLGPLPGGAVFLAARKIDSVEDTFVATGCRFVGKARPDPDEIIRVYAVTQEALWRLIDGGVIRTAGTLIAAFRAHRAGYLDDAAYRQGMKLAG